MAELGVVPISILSRVRGGASGEGQGWFRIRVCFFFPVSVLSKVRGGARARGGFEYGLVFVFKV